MIDGLNSHPIDLNILPQTNNTLRIIGGRYRGHRLHFIPRHRLRPTADRVRETVFNWLQGEITGCRVLDLFAGSGAMGLEALSRGAAEVVFVEQDRKTAQHIRHNLTKLTDATARSQVYSMSASAWLQHMTEPFDVVFLDPPFNSHLLIKTCQSLEESGVLTDPAWVYLEQDSQVTWPVLPEHWHWHREGSAGQAKFGLLQREGPTTIG